MDEYDDFDFEEEDDGIDYKAEDVGTGFQVPQPSPKSGGMTQQQARSEINRIMAEAQANPKHPYLDRSGSNRSRSRFRISQPAIATKVR